MMKYKRIVVILMVLLLVLLAGCAETEVQPPADEPPAAELPAESGDTDTDVTDPAETEPSLQAEYADESVTAAYPDAYEVADELSTDEYAQKILLTTEETLTDFRYFVLEYEEADDTIRLFAGAELYAADQITSDTPLLVWAAFPGVLPIRGLSFVDETGTTRSYALGQSGMDGSLLLFEF